MKKLICILTCLSVVFSFGSLCAFATEAEDAPASVTLSEYTDEAGGLPSGATAEEIEPSGTDTEPEEATDNTELPDTGADIEGTDTDNLSKEDNESGISPLPEKDTTNEGGGTAEDASNPFEILYNAALLHAGEIFSALACLFSAILMLCYRKGIMPLIEGGIGAISGSVSTISREAERQSQLSDKTKELIADKLEGAEALLNRISASFEDFDNRLKTCEGLKSFENSVREILLSQIDLLYEVFMNSSLPQYEKDRIGEMVNAMKKTAGGE
jgi:hypothetical protein